MTALEGRVGEPRPKYVRSNVKGLWGKPSVLNNVETWANVPLIVNRGADWFTADRHRGQQGHEDLLPGRQDQEHRPGGGAHGHHRCGTSSTRSAAASRAARSSRPCRPAGRPAAASPRSCCDLEVDFDELTEAGSMMGSGGMIVMDEDTCMVDVARYFIDFLTDESCGKCVPCREGLRQMHKILTQHQRGQGQGGRHRDPGGALRGRHGGLAVRPGQERPQPVPEHPALLPGRVRGAHQGEALSGAVLQGADLVLHRSGEVQGLPDLPEEVPLAGRSTAARSRSTSSTRRSATTCGVCFEVCPAALRRGEEDLGRAGSALRSRRTSGRSSGRASGHERDPPADRRQGGHARRRG